MKILLTNDDGIYAPGILALSHALRQVADVWIVAPEKEQSAVGHAITISDPLRVKELEKDGRFFGYAVGGTPADCVKIGVSRILPHRPDLVISGINLGLNAGDCVIYSGTVSAATEGTILGIPSLAVSLDTFIDPDFSTAADFTVRLAALVFRNGLPRGVLLNVNVPAVELSRIQGVAVTRQGRFTFRDGFVKRQDPRGRTYYWLEYEELTVEENGDTDLAAVRQNKISITPLQHDLTDYSFAETLKGWDIKTGKTI
jgi:5'-nucleotidase